MTEIPENHPRYFSLLTRERIVEGVNLGITSMQGLIAQGRGECFDYLLGEKTNAFAEKSETVAAAMLILAEKPIISVNGNTAALIPEQMIRLSGIVGAPLEVNLFHRTDERINRIINHLKDNGATEVLGEKGDEKLPLSHGRGTVDSDGIFSADVVVVPLEDGDRCETLVNMGKKVITIDLNPLSRTSRTATVSIVDNVVRALDGIANAALEMQDWDREQLEKLVESYDNKATLKKSLAAINENLRHMADEVL
ncbi:4-phosphopantoate--beta-alanine ligase [Methanohalophilus levihalophilus]|uniref:4-phosphopantoate--beta-alanine ligase n=1 Tax=Methanohalophilus levihalophilus TaxID=1431282 RepID=UPI001AE47A12|nr:4-phosphopantoate--beta-alanine ligase [Methanohalophilus levihalophilus]MBP2030469.1 4-phosphopantoate--beta-alanine ligase [Methanohalophilus levihalophilus]